MENIGNRLENGKLKMDDEMSEMILGLIVCITSFCLAEVSKKFARHDSANFLPSSALTARSWCKSVLLPTKTTGTLQIGNGNEIGLDYGYDLVALRAGFRFRFKFYEVSCF